MTAGGKSRFAEIRNDFLRMVIREFLPILSRYLLNHFGTLDILLLFY